VHCTGTEDPLVIGTVGTQSGVIGAVLAGGVTGVESWVAAINAAGGLDCHPVKYIVMDDGGDPSTQEADVEQEVDVDHVVAMVYLDAGLSGPSAQPFLTSKQVPVIGTDTSSDWVYQSPVYFPQGASGADLFRGSITDAADEATSKGLTRIGSLSCIESPLCSQVGALVKSFAPSLGMSDVYDGSGSVAQPDFTSNCQAAQSAKVQMFFLGMDTNSLLRVANSCDSVNYHPLYATISSILADPSIFETNPAFNGFAIGQSFYPWFATSIPAVATMNSVVKEYAPGTQVTPSVEAGWVSALLLQEATTLTPLTNPPTSKGILVGLDQIKNQTLGGITEPLTFTAGHDATPEQCFWEVELVSGNYTSPNGYKEVCQTSS
jgi:branched-chain amino acid transport system substrate-binding protein